MDIKKFLEIGLQIASVIPSPVQPFVNLALPIVVGVEQLFGPGGGAQKKEAALAMTSDAINLYNKAAGKNINTSGLMDAISKFIDAAVALEKAVAAMHPTV